MSRIMALLPLAILTACVGLAQLPAVERSADPEIAVSLRVLEERLAACHSGGTCAAELLRLGGLTRVRGFIVDEEGHDVILLGDAESGAPPLRLDDFQVALRNRWFRYAERQGSTILYSAPGCSIDPDPRVMSELDRIGRAIFATTSPQGVDPWLEKWHETARSPQAVRVLGIPFDTHFASIMVQADYDMKRLVDGTDPLGLPGLSSLSDMSLEEFLGSAKKGGGRSVSTMNRFWFCPGVNRILQGDGVTLLVSSPVTLRTEEEYLDSRGQISGTGREEPTARRFGEVFTRRYSEIAARRPIYAELERLFRFVAIVKALEAAKAFEKAGLDPISLLERGAVPSVSVARSLPGRSNVKQFHDRRRVPGGIEETHIWLPSCGGVTIDVDLVTNRIEGGLGAKAALPRRVLQARPSVRTLAWRIRDGAGSFGSGPRAPRSAVGLLEDIGDVVHRLARSDDVEIRGIESNVANFGNPKGVAS